MSKSTAKYINFKQVALELNAVAPNIPLKDLLNISTHVHTLVRDAETNAAYEAKYNAATYVDLPTIYSPDNLATWDYKNARWEFSHEALVEYTLNNPSVMALIDSDRKIAAIKELKRLTNCGIKAAKNVIEDYRVSGNTYR